MFNSHLEALLKRVAAFPSDTNITYNDWIDVATDVENQSASILASTPHHALGDILSILSKGLNSIVVAFAKGNRHSAIDLVQPLCDAILSLKHYEDDIDAVHRSSNLIDEFGARMSLTHQLNETKHCRPRESTQDPVDNPINDTDRMLLEIEALDFVLNQKWDSTAVCDSLFIIAQYADEKNLSILCEACFSLAERVVMNLNATQQLTIAMQAKVALLDAYMDQPQRIAALLMHLNDATSDSSVDFMIDMSSNLSGSGESETVVVHETREMAEITDIRDITDTPQKVGRDMLVILTDELDIVMSEIVDTLSAIDLLNDTSDEIEKRKDVQAALAELLERFAGACDAIGLSVLSEWIYAYAALMLATLDAPGPNAAQREAMLVMVPAMRYYCLTPDDPATAVALANLLVLPCWSSPWGTEEVEVMAKRLSAVEILEVTTSDGITRPSVANDSDVCLDIPDDINAELVEGLIQELPIQTAAFSEAILQIASGNGTLKDLDIAKRAAHTLKGAANTVGISGIANLTHHLEDILVALHAAETMPGRYVSHILVEAGDCLETMSEAVQGIVPAPTDRLKVLQNVLDLANQIDECGIPDSESAGIVGIRLDEHSGDSGAVHPAESVVAPAVVASNMSATVRVPASLIDELLNLVNESIISAAQLREQLAQSREMTSRTRSQNEILQSLVGQLEHMVDIRGLGIGSHLYATSSGEHEFDELEFERFNELQTLSRQLTEASVDTKTILNDGSLQLENFNELVEQHHRLQIRSQDLVMRTRMVPVVTIEPRLQRSARQTSRLLDKEVILDIEGGETLMDSHVLQALVDPLMHIIRNAIDHGLEMPDERDAIGKSRVGHIRLSFNREGNSLVVRCRDDGQGLDHHLIRRKAEAIGMVTPDQELSAEEVMRLILRHGFSTRDEASQISGRGIGMDAVLASIHDLKGTLFLHNELGRGLTVELRMPVSLVASHALLVSCGGQVYALSTSGIHDLIYLDLSDVSVTEDGQMQVQVNGSKQRLTDLEELLCVPQLQNEHRTGFPVVVVQLDTGTLEAVRLQAVYYSRDIVVKDLGEFVPRMSGLLGATILGNGDVAPVIDLRELATKVTEGGLNAWRHNHTQQAVLEATEKMKALVVDDSLSARRNTVQFMADIGFDVRVANDGVDAVTMMEEWVPDIVLTDMEMPRMNGLELASYVRSQQRLSSVPIVMISSRSTDKHRRKASNAGVTDYFVKPYNEDLLIESIIKLTHIKSLDIVENV